MTPPPDISVATAGSKAGFWVTLLAALGCFAIFWIILGVTYVPLRQMAPEVDLLKIPLTEQWKYTPAGRQAYFDNMRAREMAAATYAWIDKKNGVVQLPIDRAMVLTLRELNGERKP
jgi:hypothetical protein